MKKFLVAGIIFLFVGAGVISSSVGTLEGKITFLNLNSGSYIQDLIVVVNQPPYAPSIAGNIYGKIGVEYEYIFISVDPDGDDVKCFIDWDDGDSDETGFNPSGTVVKLNHTWNNEGNYTIRAYAEDEFGLIGPEANLTVKIRRPDEYSEIFSFIKGKVYNYNRIGLFSVNMLGNIDIFALTTTGFINISSKIGNATQVETNFFIGWFRKEGWGLIRVNGVAFGNIDWYMY